MQVHFVCYDQYIGKCSTCSATICQLEKDNTLPHIVTKVVRQGPMTMQTQVLNPQLVDKYCRAGCLCFDGNNCVRQTIQSCQNYKLIVLKHQ